MIVRVEDLVAVIVWNDEALDNDRVVEVTVHNGLDAAIDFASEERLDNFERIIAKVANQGL